MAKYDVTRFSECFNAVSPINRREPKELPRFFKQVDWTRSQNQEDLLQRITWMDNAHDAPYAVQILATAGQAGLFQEEAFMLRFFSLRNHDSELITDNRSITNTYAKTMSPDLVFKNKDQIIQAIGCLKMVQLIMFGLGYPTAIGKYPKQTLEVLTTVVEDPETRSFLLSWGFTPRLIKVSLLPEEVQKGYTEFFCKLEQE